MTVSGSGDRGRRGAMGGPRSTAYAAIEVTAALGAIRAGRSATRPTPRSLGRSVPKAHRPSASRSAGNVFVLATSANGWWLRGLDDIESRAS